jgi:hypothetical protein
MPVRAGDDESKQMTIKNWIPRLLVLPVLSGFGILLLANFSGLGDRILQVQEEYVLVRFIFAAIGILCPFSTFLLWGLMLYDWGNRDFTTVSCKKLWFLMLTLGMFVGSWFYYALVFEMGSATKNRTIGEN